MRPSTNRLRSAPFQGANTGSSPVGCTICERGVMAATRRLERRAERRAGSSPVARTKWFSVSSSPKDRYGMNTRCVPDRALTAAGLGAGTK